MRALILGIGNEIRRDDAVGLVAAREISKQIDNENIEIKETSAGGLSLLTKIEGYDKVFIIDSIVTKDGEPGHWYYLSLNDLNSGGGRTVSHSIDLKTMKNIGEKMGEKVPEIRIFAIEVKDPFEFGEDLTEELEESLPEVISEIKETIDKETRERGE
ncbi:hypothetical protein AKJ51_03580 [candidate division MSBL1 archaeon SCGC-AAA382A20]|uniref:Hydrogenase maturation protease n=1 Tax=candidate division MSBL1 archaeon SCGC-AAA382A20 TaxID=1698280 RepID=A0A133VJA8_9EURY|nr:hypothetical protein AKJ51_03580 [candidate division MSBL1 archaeon SCGC-AAA382A20]